MIGTGECNLWKGPYLANLSTSLLTLGIGISVNKLVLDDISGHFERGKISLAIGTSGTGKSVLLKCLVGIIQPTAGSINFDKRDMLEGDKSKVDRFARNCV